MLEYGIQHDYNIIAWLIASKTSSRINIESGIAVKRRMSEGGVVIECPEEISAFQRNVGCESENNP